MKVRFVGGPYHGKTRDVGLLRGPIMVADWGKRPNLRDCSSPYPQSDVMIRSHRYEVRMMSIDLGNGERYRAPAVHPDGSIFLVHENYGKSK